MNTPKLQSFAANARTQLMRAVQARLDEAMVPDSLARIDTPQTFNKLTDEIDELGGGQDGRQRLVERYAYRWFNRIIAFRYMDAKGFTGVPVVSPIDLTSTIALPEVLAAAKRGEYDPDVFDSDISGNAKAKQTIEGLFNGVVPDNDPQGRAYSLLLQAHSRYWHTLMPFMFATGGSVDELLMPTNLLANGSVLRQATEAMGIEDCDQGVEIIGWLYQFYIAERKDEVMDGFNHSHKAGAAEIPAATQLFTPKWIVRYLVQNSVGRLWMENHSESELSQGWEYYIQPEKDATTNENNTKDDDYLVVSSPEELTVCDPACGSGHFLTYTFDLLYDVYEEEGYAPAEIPGLILTKNLFGMDIDERAEELASFALVMKARERDRRFFRRHTADDTPITPNILQVTPESFTTDEVTELNRLYNINLSEESWNTYEHADIYGSLIEPDTELATVADNIPGTVSKTLFDQDLVERGNTVLTQTRYLASTYAAVVANPPYMGSSNMGAELKKFVTKHFKDGKSDLFAAFMLRDLHLLKPNAMLGMITMQSWMFLSSFEQLRTKFINNSTITTMAHLGAGAFDSIGGEVVSTTAFTVQKATGSQDGTYIRLIEVHGDQNQADTCKKSIDSNSELLHRVSQDQFSKIPGSPIVYWLSESLVNTFSKRKPLKDVAKPRQGLATADNNRFIREWWEVSHTNSAFGCMTRDEAQATGMKWFPYNKGGEFRKWYGNQDYVVNWKDDGEEIIDFKPRSVIRNPETYFLPSISWSKISSGAPAFRYFPKGFIYDVAGTSIFCDATAQDEILAYTNSSTAYSELMAIAPTLNFEVGQIGSLPIDISQSPQINDTVLALIQSAKSDWDSYETSWDFSSNALISGYVNESLEQRIDSYYASWQQTSVEQQSRETLNNELVADAYGVRDDVECDVSLERVSLKRNAAFTYRNKSPAERGELFKCDVVKELISYAVGCMFGRYSIDKPGLILASQGETIDVFHARVPNSRFEPDGDNVIPITADERFEDDIIARFRQWLKVAFGQGHLAENLAYIEQTLGKDLRKYFMNDFYDDHVKRYSKRPIYWMYSSRRDNKGAFKALVYLHRYTPHTTDRVLAYLRDFRTSVNDEADRFDQLDGPRAARQADKLRKASAECKVYEDNVLYPLATRNLAIDLDDGVLVNYLRLGDALRKIESIEKKRKDVLKLTWPIHPLQDVSD